MNITPIYAVIIKEQSELINKKLLRSAFEFDVHWVSEHKEVNGICDVLFNEIENKKKTHNGRIKNKDIYREHLRKLVLDLLVAYKLRQNPYRAISKNKSDYQAKSGSRYSKIFLKYDPLIGCLNELVALGYIEEKKGYRFTNDSRRTRIKASNKLLALFENPEYELSSLIKKNGILNVVSYGSSINFVETIILKDESKTIITYEDDELTKSMRGNLERINNALEKAHIILDITDEQYRELANILNKRWEEADKISVDLSKKRLHRVFNNSAFDNGGRFYGAWWVNLPKDYRKHIRINYKDTIEVDYSAHHIRMLYAEKNIELIDRNDPYQIDGIDREVAKQAMLLILNNQDKTKAINTMRSQGIKKAKFVCEKLEEKHYRIKDKFYQVEANVLMNKDSKIAEKVMLRMLDIGLEVLPIHDSFIVSRKYEELLMSIMQEEFFKEFNKTTFTKSKGILNREPLIYNNDSTINIQESFEMLINKDDDKSIIREIWGVR